MVAEGMEGYLVDWAVMSVVVLDQLAQSSVPNFDGAVNC